MAHTQPGFCVAQDKFVDLLLNEANQTSAGGLANRYGCQSPRYDANTVRCEPGSANPCNGMDTCGNRVPAQIFIGGKQNPRRPFAIAAGPLTDPLAWELVAATDNGLELLVRTADGKGFDWKSTPKVNTPIHGLVVTNLDSTTDANGDVVWFSSKKCLDAFDDACPYFRRPDEGEVNEGCLGLYYTDQQSSVFQIRAPSRGGCRRFALDFSPSALCTGDMNKDGYVDVAVASETSDKVYIFSGDGRGGIRADPEVFSLPSGAKGGPIACGDLDSDGIDDVLVASRSSNALVLLRSGS